MTQTLPRFKSLVPNAAIDNSEILPWRQWRRGWGRSAGTPSVGSRIDLREWFGLLSTRQRDSGGCRRTGLQQPRRTWPEGVHAEGVIRRASKLRPQNFEQCLAIVFPKSQRPYLKGSIWSKIIGLVNFTITRILKFLDRLINIEHCWQSRRDRAPKLLDCAAWDRLLRLSLQAFWLTFSIE